MFEVRGVPGNLHAWQHTKHALDACVEYKELIMRGGVERKRSVLTKERHWLYSGAEHRAHYL